jgi:hypothetical protein
VAQLKQRAESQGALRPPPSKPKTPAQP